MNREKIESFINNNQDNIVGVSVNDYYYNVDYILDYNLEFDNEPVLICYELEYTKYSSDYKQVAETCFTMNDLLGMDKLEFFELKKMQF